MRWRIDAVKGWLPGILLLFSWTGSFAQTDPISLVIFPYGAPDPQVVEASGYALYAVPDLLREKLESSGRFRFLDLPPGGRNLGTDLEGHEARLEAAREAGADYLVWGYLVSSASGLKVVHRVMEARQGAAVKVLSQDLPKGAGLIDAMDRSVLDLAAGLDTELVPLPPRVITVERVVVAQSPPALESAAVTSAGDPEFPPSDFTLGSGLTVFTGSYAGVLAGALFLRAEITHPLDARGSWDWGADVMIHGVKAAEGAQLAADQVPDLAYIPLLLKTSRRWTILGFLDLGWEIKAGGTLLFGTLGGTPTLLFRPSWSTGPLVELWPSQSLGLRFQLDYLGTFLDWGKNYLPSLRLGLGFRFDT